MMYRANLDEVDITERTRRALKKAGYYSLYQLPRNPDQLLKLAFRLRIGRMGFNDIHQAQQQLL